MAKCYASKVIAQALGEVGYLEKKSNKNLDDKTANAGSKNYTKYAKMLDDLGYFYNGKKNGYAWCDVFVDSQFVAAYGVEDAMRLLCQPKKSYGAGVKYSRDYYKKKGQFHKKDPKPGDQIFFYKANLVTLAHTGLVVDVDDTYVYTVEGNTSGASGVVANGGGVAKKKYKLTYKRINGYGRPAYDEAEIVDESDVEKVDPVPAIKKGDTVKVNKGAKTYDGKGLASFIYTRKHKVKEIKGDRVVITYGGVVVAAVHANDLTKVG